MAVKFNLIRYRFLSVLLVAIAFSNFFIPNANALTCGPFQILNPGGACDWGWDRNCDFNCGRHLPLDPGSYGACITSENACKNVRNLVCTPVDICDPISSSQFLAQTSYDEWASLTGKVVTDLIPPPLLGLFKACTENPAKCPEETRDIILYCAKYPAQCVPGLSPNRGDEGVTSLCNNYNQPHSTSWYEDWGKGSGEGRTVIVGPQAIWKQHNPMIEDLVVVNQNGNPLRISEVSPEDASKIEGDKCIGRCGNDCNFPGHNLFYSKDCLDHDACGSTHDNDYNDAPNDILNPYCFNALMNGVDDTLYAQTHSCENGKVTSPTAMSFGKNVYLESGNKSYPITVYGGDRVELEIVGSPNVIFQSIMLHNGNNIMNSCQETATTLTCERDVFYLDNWIITLYVPSNTEFSLQVTSFENGIVSTKLYSKKFLGIITSIIVTSLLN